jgi:SAM-dependent methyltransferase
MHHPSVEDVPDRQRRRASFDGVAELYDRARPGYPEPLFDDLVSLGRLPAGSRVLEIGCGPGQATLPLAQRGLRLLCVELGPRLAALTRRKTEAWPDVEVVNADFETWEPDEDGFDGIVSFTAFHWIEPETRYEKTARLLREGGALAVASTKHVALETSDPFWAEVQADYDAVLPDDDNGPPPRPEDAGDRSEEIGASGRFRNVAVRRYLWDVRYTAGEYVAVLDTYSANRVLEPSVRDELFGRIRRRIEATPERAVTKTYLATLNVAERI